MNPFWLMDVSLGSDGHCTGFQWIEGLVAGARACCQAHDLGGTDEALQLCLNAATSGQASALIAIGVGLMVAFRPVYNWLQRRKIVK